MYKLLLILCCAAPLFAGRFDVTLSVDKLNDEHLDRSIYPGSLTDTFKVYFEDTYWNFAKKRNSSQSLYNGVELGKDTLASTAILYGLRLHTITDSTLILSGKRQVKREGQYYGELSRLDSIVVYKEGLTKVTVGKTKRQRLVFPIIAISVFGALAAFNSYKSRD